MNKNDLVKPKKPRSVTHQAAINASGAGAHKDKKKAMKQGDVKHKSQYDYMEHLNQQLVTVLAEETDVVVRDKEGKVKSWSHEGDWKKASGKDPVGKIHNLSDKARRETEKLASKNEHTDDSGEYNDEAGMVKNNLHTIARMCDVLHKELADNENLPEWVEEKISQAKGMMVTVTDYMVSQHEHGDTHLTDEATELDEKWSQKYKNSINCAHPKGFSQKAHCAGKRKHNESVEMEMTCPDCGMCQTHGNLSEVKQRLDAKCWKGKHKEGTKIKGGIRVNNCVPNEDVEETAEWQKSSGKNKNGGLNKKGVASYRREHPGSKLKTAVTKKPSELKAGSKDAKRRKSFCARMKGMKKSRTSAKTAHDPNSRINKSLRKWHCESIEEMAQMIVNAERFLAESKKK